MNAAYAADRLGLTGLHLYTDAMITVVVTE